MALKLDLQKSAAKLQLDLSKAGVTKIPAMELAFDMDVSGSYKDEHKDGTTNALLTRLVPWGMVFDPDKQLDLFTFSRGVGAAHHVDMVTMENYEDFVRRNIIDKVPGWCGGTVYAPVLRANLETFGWVAPELAEASAPSGGFFGKMFGRGASAPGPASAVELNPRKSLVVFNTDGDSDDEAATWRIFEEMERGGYGMFVLFLAVSNQGGTFSFLRKLEGRYKNVGLCVIRDVRRWVEQDDEAINSELITPKLTSWLNA
ncbi:VWA domain-containing protein [Candidatus Kaiserbacteria bacterium]|nr:VWA domain-containing protein [Candidatus Kaiserbacteria bacterium]